MLALRSIARRVLQLTAEERELAREIEAPGWSSSCGASLRVSASISRASSRSSAVSAAEFWIASTVGSSCCEALQ